ILAVAAARVALADPGGPEPLTDLRAALAARCGLMVVEEHGQRGDHVHGGQEVKAKDREVLAEVNQSLFERTAVATPLLQKLILHSRVSLHVLLPPGDRFLQCSPTDIVLPFRVNESEPEEYGCIVQVTEVVW